MIGALLTRDMTGDKVLLIFRTACRGGRFRELLEKNGVVYSHVAFELLTRMHQQQPLQAGEYLFDAAMSPRDVIDKIANGRVYVHSVTIPEGWTMFDIADELERQGLCRRAGFSGGCARPVDHSRYCAGCAFARWLSVSGHVRFCEAFHAAAIGGGDGAAVSHRVGVIPGNWPR